MGDMTSRAVSVDCTDFVSTARLSRGGVSVIVETSRDIMKEARDAIELTSCFMFAFFGRGREPEPLQLRFFCSHLA